MAKKKTIVAALLAAMALVAAACRGDTGGGDGGGDGEIKTGDGVTSEACPDTPNKVNGCIYLGVISV
ncbi:MAG: hypothetical protein ACRDQB_09535, partial [Thermocrispum sp.]